MRKVLPLIAVMLMTACSDDTDDRRVTIGDTGESNTSEDTGFVTIDVGDPGGPDTGFIPDAVAVGPDQGPLDVGFEVPDVGPFVPEVGVGMPDAGFTPDVGPTDTGALPPDAGIDDSCDPAFFDTGGACGGNPVGTWFVRDLCGASEALSQLLATLNAACTGNTVLSSMRTATGTLTFTNNGRFDLAIDETNQATLTIGNQCVAILGSCAAVQTFATMNGVPSICSTVGGVCRCDATQTTSTVDNGTYGMMMNQLTLNGSSVVTLDYCISGGVFRYRAAGGTSTFVLLP